MLSMLIVTLAFASFLTEHPVDATTTDKADQSDVKQHDIDSPFHKSRELQAGDAAETCGWSPWWRFENDPLYLRRNPKVPCLRHSDCASYTARMLQAPFEPCCLARDCIWCGSTQSEFIPGVNRCARFACTSDADCGPGRCMTGVCSFSNVQPACTTDASCGGGNNVCHNGVCHIRNPENGFLTLARGGMGGGMSSTGNAVVGTESGAMSSGMGMGMMMMMR